MINEAKTHAEAKKTYLVLSAIYLFMAITAWIVSSTFIVMWMTDGTLNFSGWSYEMWLYCFTGLMITAAITLGQYVHYQSGGSEGYKSALVSLAVVLMFVTFSAGSEIGNVLQRHDASQQGKSVNSETFKASKDNYNQAIGAVTNVSVSPAMQKAIDEKANADFEISNCQRHASRGQARVNKCLAHERGKYSAAANKIRDLERLESSAKQNNVGALETAKDHMKELANNDDHAAAIVKFFMLALGLGALQTALLIAAFIVIAFEVAYHLAGTLKRQAKIHLNSFSSRPTRTPEFASRRVEPEAHQEAPKKPSGFIPFFGAGIGIGGDGLTPTIGAGAMVAPKASSVNSEAKSRPDLKVGQTELHSAESGPEISPPFQGFKPSSNTDSTAKSLDASSKSVNQNEDDSAARESAYQEFKSILVHRNDPVFFNKKNQPRISDGKCRPMVIKVLGKHGIAETVQQAQKTYLKWARRAISENVPKLRESTGKVDRNNPRFYWTDAQ